MNHLLKAKEEIHSKAMLPRIILKVKIILMGNLYQQKVMTNKAVPLDQKTWNIPPLSNL